MKSALMSVLRITLVTSITMAFISCCTRGYASKNSEQELREMANYIYDYSDGKMGNPLIPITFLDLSEEEADQGEEVVGQCRLGWNTEIVISKKYWDNVNTMSRMLLIAHELAHCECDLDHLDDEYKDGCPKHYLNSTTINYYCRNKYKEEYLKQIAQGCGE